MGVASALVGVPAMNWVGRVPVTSVGGASLAQAVSQNTEEGAIKAVNYFFALYRYAFITGDTADLAAMSEDACVFCKSTIDDATKLHQGGGWANPWETNLNDLYYIPPGEGKEYSGIQGTITSSASTTVRGSGETTEKSAETLSFFVALKYADEAWTIKGVSVE